MRIEANEAEFQQNVLNSLEKYFEIQTQVKGTHFSGNSMILDAVLIPKNKQEWKNEHVALGIEFKSPSKLKSTTDITHWATQCIDYANTR